MSFLDKAKEFADKHDDKVDQLLEKAGDFVDERTGHQHSEHIDKAVDAAQQHTGAGNTTEQQ